MKPSLLLRCSCFYMFLIIWESHHLLSSFQNSVAHAFASNSRYFRTRNLGKERKVALPTTSLLSSPAQSRTDQSLCRSFSSIARAPLLRLKSLSDKTKNANDDNDDVLRYNQQTAITIVGGQSLFVVIAMIASLLIGTPNLGFGPNINFSLSALQLGTILTIPLGLFAFVLDAVEDKYPALQDVTKATQRSVLALMGGTFRPVLAIGLAVALGLAAGFGEELLFRGVFQSEMGARVGDWIGLTVSSVVFGALHAVTPLYAVLATVASLYFGALYLFTDNLAVPITCHAVYDIGALFYAHYAVCQLSVSEQKSLAS